jgi:DNA-directed RNA polymerase subunit RPC12/RpoP
MNQTSDHIVQCPSCGTKNRIRPEKAGASAKCGECGTPLPAEGPEAKRHDTHMFRCQACGTKNRIPANMVTDGVKCGKCGAHLNTKELFAPQPMEITDADFESKVMKSPLPVLLFAWASW